MDDVLKLIATIVGGGGALGVIGFGILYAVKGAIVTAVEQAGKVEIANVKGALDAELDAKRNAFAQEQDRIKADMTTSGNKEVERLKAELTKEIERERQTYYRENERDRQKAASVLEQFKAEFALAAEVRRQVAAKKIEIVGKVIALGEASLPDYQVDGHDQMAALDDLESLLRGNSHLFPAAVARELDDYRNVVATIKDDPEDRPKLELATERLRRVLRAELYIEGASQGSEGS